MKVNITSRTRNALLRRREVVFEVDHRDVGGTPSRLEVRKELASLLKTDLELVYVKKMETKRGLMVAVGEANAYDSVEDARLVEPEYVIARNVPPEKPAEEEGAEKLKVKPKETAEKPAEEEKAEEKKEEVKEVAEKPKEPAEKAGEKPEETKEGVAE